MQDDLGLNMYDIHARAYDPVLCRTWQIDPLANNYYSLSPYSWVANNPLIFIDPTGMWIDWSGVSGKEKRIIKQSLRKHNSSTTYRNLYKQLKKSDNRYLIKSEFNDETATGAYFEGNTKMVLDGGDNTTFTMQNAGTQDDFGEDEKGGKIVFNFGMVDVFDKKDKVSLLGDFAVEEIAHAVQYDNLNQEDNLNGLPGTANTEFEAKAIVGQIKLESKKDMSTGKVDAIAHSYGKNAFKTGVININDYRNALEKWHTDPTLSKSYSRRKRTSAYPTTLERLIK